MIYLSLIPFIAYWGTCLILNVFKLGQNNNKLLKLNIVDKKTVFLNVLGSTIFHTFISFNLYYFNILDLIKMRYQYILYGIILVDTIEYFMHRALHKYKFLYKFHKVHHELNNPYNFGALYNSTIEGIIESLLLLLGFILFNFSFNEYIIVVALANIATVLDHSYLNYKKYFHYLHHSKYPNYNFQQPFFTFWDRIFNTYKE